MKNSYSNIYTLDKKNLKKAIDYLNKSNVIGLPTETVYGLGGNAYSKNSIKKIVKKNKFILVGSSMGAWISLNQFKYFKKQIKGFIGIGSAPEFLERLMWKKFTKKMKKEIKTKGIITIKHGRSSFKNKLNEYPITFQLIKDGRKNKILSKKIRSKIKVTMVHGSKDEVVPLSFSRKVLSIFPSAQKKLIVIKNGDHSLSNLAPIKKIIKELNNIVKDII